MLAQDNSIHSSDSDLLAKLRSTISKLGSHGGLVSPSVYETAQVLRLYPPIEGVIPGLQWLLTQQNADGGWGVPTVPSARDVPTLAAVLALHTYRDIFAAGGAIQAGLDFLQRQARQWKSMHIDLVPIAAEMILPYLLQEAEKSGLLIDQRPYARVFELRQIKLRYLEGKPLTPNSAPTYSWEALGRPHTTDIFDSRTGVGHSPAATAAWLRTARESGEDGMLYIQAASYLARAAAATGTQIPGVMPMVYPITGFELGYGLYTLLLTGLLDHPELQDVVGPKAAELQVALDREQGLSFGERFVADVDVTAVAVAVMRALQRPTKVEFVRRFWHDDHFYTYAHELNPSVFSNAHALHALVLCGEPCRLTESFLIRRQMESGAWMADKWHTSWRSSTLEVVAALIQLGNEKQLARAGQALIDDQNSDGSWGHSQGAPLLETAYAVIALQLLSSKPHLADKLQVALQKGWRWLWDHQDQLSTVEHTWLGKEVYSAVRVDEVYKLSAILSPLFGMASQRDEQSANVPPLVAQLREKYL